MTILNLSIHFELVHASLRVSPKVATGLNDAVPVFFAAVDGSKENRHRII